MSEDPTTSTRVRITFSTSGPLSYISVLDLGRLWERGLRRSGIPLRYSEGFNPRPKMQFAAPLPTGCGGDAEWLDIWLTEERGLQSIQTDLENNLPPNMCVLRIDAVPGNAPALSEQLEAVLYRVLLRNVDAKEVANACSALLDGTTLIRPKRGRRRHQSYDLRQLIESLDVAPAPAPWTTAIHMRLAARAGATGRPDEVLDALGLADLPRRCTRSSLLLAGSAEDTGC